MAAEIWPVLRIETWHTDWEVEKQVRHAARADGTAHERQRDDADPACLALGWRAGVMADEEVWRPIPQPEPGDDGKPLRLPLNKLPEVTRIDLAISERLAATGAIVRGKQARAAGMIVGISAAWVEETGGLHDPHNPRMRQLWDHTVRWAEDIAGGRPGAVVAARFDRDEKGGAIVDICLVPVHDLSIGRTKKDGSRPAPRPVVAVSRAFERLNEKIQLPSGGKIQGRPRRLVQMGEKLPRTAHSAWAVSESHQEKKPASG